MLFKKKCWYSVVFGNWRQICGRNRIFGIGNRAKYSVSAKVKNSGFGRSLAKTQVMIGGAKAKDVSNVIIIVDGAEVRPGNAFELLRVTFDQSFTLRPYLTSLLKEDRFWAGCIARLAQHLPVDNCCGSWGVDS
jgi:hypothetical protein